MSGALEGLVVLDLTRYLSGPHCTLLLAGLGAEVIKIDAPAGGDPAALAPPYSGPSFVRASPQDFGLAYLKRARGKKSTTLNLKDSRGRELLLRLAEHADVVVENFRPGVAARLGIDYPVLQQRNPRLVYCAISGYGATGPDRETKSYDLMAQAEAGLMSITGEPEGPPMKTGGALADMIAGSYAALGIVAALKERERSGLGQSVDVSMVDCLFSMMMDEPLDSYDKLGLGARQGNRIKDVTAQEDLERIRQLFDDLERKRDLVQLLGLSEDADGVRIFIGSENKLFSLSGSSLIVAPFHDDRRKIVGVLGVIGPTRINYARIIPMVDYTAKLVSRLLT
jgi:formyl-CoA transferase